MPARPRLTDRVLREGATWTPRGAALSTRRRAALLTLLRPPPAPYRRLPLNAPASRRREDAVESLAPRAAGRALPRAGQPAVLALA